MESSNDILTKIIEAKRVLRKYQDMPSLMAMAEAKLRQEKYQTMFNYN